MLKTRVEPFVLVADDRLSDRQLDAGLVEIMGTRPLIATLRA